MLLTTHFIHIYCKLLSLKTLCGNCSVCIIYKQQCRGVSWVLGEPECFAPGDIAQHSATLEKSTECVQFVQKLWTGQRFEIVKCNVWQYVVKHNYLLCTVGEDCTECNIVLCSSKPWRRQIQCIEVKCNALK